MSDSGLAAWVPIVRNGERRREDAPAVVDLGVSVSALGKPYVIKHVFGVVTQGTF